MSALPTKNGDMLTSAVKRSDVVSNTNAQEIMNQIVSEYAGLVKYIAVQIMGRLPSHVMVEDLICAGMIGLIDAVNKYDASRANKFKTYAEHRIRGEILDELRALDVLPRTMRAAINSIERTAAELEKQLNRGASDEELAAALGVTLESYYHNEGRVRAINVVSLDEQALVKMDNITQHESLTCAAENDPVHLLERKRLLEKLEKVMRCLPIKQRQVIIKYYFEDKSFKEIGVELHLTESRVSQIHKHAMAKLKRFAPAEMNDLDC